jgi:hypothetical protein
MKKCKWIFLFCFFLLLSANLFSLDVKITGGDLNFAAGGEYNRAYNYGLETRIYGGIELNNRFIFKTGAALGSLGSEIDIKAFGLGRFVPFIGKGSGFNISLLYTNYSIPEYDMCSNAILSCIAYNGRRAGIATGINLRFTRFFDDPAVFESMLSVSAYINFINRERVLIGFKIANFDDFYAGNTANVTLSLSGLFRVNRQFALFTELKLIPSGIDGLTTTFYGIVYRGGFSILW